MLRARSRAITNQKHHIVVGMMLARSASQNRSSLAINAVRLLPPDCPIPASIVPFDLDAFHALLDRPAQDVFARRFGEKDMAIVPLQADADLPAPAVDVSASDNIRLFAALAREAIFRHLVALPDSYRVVSRRPPIVESAKLENILPTSLGLPLWLKKRAVLVFETRTIKHPGEEPYVVLTCAKRLRTVIDADCRQLHEIGVPLLGSDVSAWKGNPDPKVASRLRFAGRVTALRDGVLISHRPR